MNIARMGDLVQSSPLISGLKKEDPNCEITLLCSHWFESAARMLNGVDRIVTVSYDEIVRELIKPRGGILAGYELLRDLVDEMRNLKFDRVINITHTDISSIITSIIEGKETSGMTLDVDGYKVVNGSWANYYLNSCLNRAFNMFNMVDMHCRIGGIHGVQSFELNVNPEAEANAAELLAEANDPNAVFAAVVPGASTEEKAWQVQHFATALWHAKNQFSFVPIIVGSKSEEERCGKLAEMVPGSLNLCGRTDLETLYALLEKCDLCVTNDTGPMHIAAAAGTKILDISLGSALSYETAPYGAGHVVIEPRIDCYPCLPKLRCGHLSCHARIQPTVVGDLISNLLKNKRIDLQDIDEASLRTVNLFKTGFDEDGFWQLIPLTRPDIDIKVVFNQALREMWKRYLSGTPSWSDELADAAKQMGSVIASQYDCRNSAIDLSEITESLTNVKDLSTQGINASSELTKLAEDQREIERINALGRALQDIDMSLVRIAYVNPAIGPLIAQFTYAKDNLEGWKLKSLAAQTKSLYVDLIEWSSALENWLKAILKGIEEAVNEEAAA